jgi:ubiquinone/menaquinone biosynthesis C-methylase UbiE
MAEENHIKEYLDMQRQKYQERASYAVITPQGVDPLTDGVVGSYIEQEKFPYDANIFKHFKGDPKESSVLEYGCGPGRNILRIAKRFKFVAGCDISIYNLNNLAKLMALNGISNVRGIHTTGDNIPAGDNMFDIVFEVICLQHICSYTIRKRILTDMCRVCKPGGMVVCQFGFNKKIPPETHYVGYHAEQLRGVYDTNGWADCCVMDEKEIRDDFTQIRFTVEDIWHTGIVMDQNHDSWVWICGRK